MSSPSTAELRYDGQVVIITGAGRGMGRDHALLLSKRGAKIVLNDLTAELANPAVDEIKAAGGDVIAVVGSVAERSVTEKIVQTAIDTFGRIDVLINNAGIDIKRNFDEFTDDQFHRTIDINLFGSWALCQICWPHMKKQRYGRIINVCSTSIFGMPENAAYTASKAGLFGLGQALATESAEYGILINSLGPSASTAMSRVFVTDPGQQAWMDNIFPPSTISPVAAWLAHKDCTLNGQFVTCYGTNFGRLFLGETRGFAGKSTESYTVETIRDNFAVAADEKGYIVPKSTTEEIQALLGFRSHN